MNCRFCGGPVIWVEPFHSMSGGAHLVHEETLLRHCNPDFEYRIALREPQPVLNMAEARAN